MRSEDIGFESAATIAPLIWEWKALNRTRFNDNNRTEGAVTFREDRIITENAYPTHNLWLERGKKAVENRIRASERERARVFIVWR